MHGLVSKADFEKLGQDAKLLDFGGAMGEKRKQQTPRKERRKLGEEGEGREKVGTRIRHILACVCIDQAKTFDALVIFQNL